MSNKPLSGYTVIDFSAVYAGPICTRFLRDCGAEVIKIEPPEMGDLTRGAQGMTPAFAHFNAGKRSLALNLKTAEGQQLAGALVRQADIVVQNFRPGIMARFGLDHDSLMPQQPKLVYCSISGFGQSGPWNDRAAFAPIVHAASGFDTVFAAGQPDFGERPPNWDIMVADMLTGAYAFGAIQTALLGRERFGQGEHLDISMMEAMMSLIPAQLQAVQMEKPLPIGRFYPVRTMDGFVMITPVTNKIFQRLCELLNRSELLKDPRFVYGKRTNHYRELATEVEQWSCTLSTKECVEALNAVGVPCSDYARLEDLFDHSQCLERESFSSVSAQPFGEFLIQSLPIKFQNMSSKSASWVPVLGQHSQEILSTMLKLSTTEIDRLHCQGIIHCSEAEVSLP
ncbi:MAG: CoA transferase [Gammaproteobacteria bacterium]|nr:CoA transferase [Gammaproteobacteria bacterium]